MDHDVVVAGAGHNGLVAAAYLAQAGLDVCVVEARGTVGGCASTVDALGTRVNICNCDHAMVRATPIADELGLADHGLRYLDVEPVQLSVFWDDTVAPWFIFHDVVRTLESLRLAHPGQVDAYRRYLDVALPAARLVLDMAEGLPTVGRAVGRVAARRGAGVATLLTWSRRSAGDVLRSFFTSEALLAPVVTTGPAVWGLSPEAPGTGLGALGYAMKHLVPVGRPVGGSGALPLALESAIGAAGGTVRCGARVAEICCEGDAVRGVALTDGTVIEAGTVVAAADPRDAFVSWLRSPPASAVVVVERWRAKERPSGYESKLDAVITALPRYRGMNDRVLARLGVSEALVPTAIVSPPLSGIAAAHRLLGEGRVADRPMHYANLPSVLDPSMVPAGGGHVFSLETLFTPYSLASGDWTTSGEGERWLANYASLVEPGFLDTVERFRVVTPPDYERDFSMPKGYAPSFGGSPLAALVGRREPELTRYETPIAGLYLCGAGTFPGAGVWGASGRNAASVVLRRANSGGEQGGASTGVRSSRR